MSKPSEAALAAEVVAYLENCGHDVYQEVECSGGIADIVAIVGPCRDVWVVETKTTWSLALLEQCVDRRRSAHRVYAAVPVGRVSHASLFDSLGIGTMIVKFPLPEHHRYGTAGEVRIERPAPRVSSNPKHGSSLRAVCCDGHKTHAKAGAVGGGRFTPFVRTCENLREFVTRRPGATLREAIDGIRHHYSSPSLARSSIPQWIEAGKVPGVRVERVDGRIRLHPEAP